MREDVPKFRSVVNSIKLGIEKGIYRRGEPIPSEAELCSLFGISRMTARRALDELVAAGELYRVQGSGTFVSHIELQKTYQPHGFTHNMQGLGVKPSSRVLEFKTEKPNGECRKALGLGEGESVILLKRLRMADLEPVAVETVMLSCLRFPKILERDYSTSSLYDALREEYGLEAGYSHQRISAENVEGEDARLLFAGGSGIALHVRNTDYDRNQHPIVFADSLYHGTKYTLDVIIK